MTQCKLCGEAKRFADSHIIPRSLYGTTLGHPSGTARILSSSANVHPKRSPMGEYDPALLCTDCEASLSSCDGYAHELFVCRTPDAEVRDSSGVHYYRYDGVDLGLLRFFFVTLTWRMHATNRPMFKNLSLGADAERFRVATLNKTLDAIPEFDVVIIKFDHSDMGVLGPTRLPIDGVNGFRVAFGGFSAWLKIDQRPFPPEFAAKALSAGEPLRMIAMNFNESPEFRAMLRLVRARRP